MALAAAVSAPPRRVASGSPGGDEAMATGWRHLPPIQRWSPPRRARSRCGRSRPASRPAATPRGGSVGAPRPAGAPAGIAHGLAAVRRRAGERATQRWPRRRAPADRAAVAEPGGCPPPRPRPPPWPRRGRGRRPGRPRLRPPASRWPRCLSARSQTVRRGGRPVVGRVGSSGRSRRRRRRCFRCCGCLRCRQRSGGPAGRRATGPAATRGTPAPGQSAGGADRAAEPTLGARPGTEQPEPAAPGLQRAAELPTPGCRRPRPVPRQPVPRRCRPRDGPGWGRR